MDRAALDKRWSEIAKLRTEFDNTIQQFRLRYNGGQIEKSSSFVKPISNSNLLYNVPEQENHNPDVVNWNNFMLKSPFNFEKWNFSTNESYQPFQQNVGKIYLSNPQNRDSTNGTYYSSNDPTQLPPLVKNRPQNTEYIAPSDNTRITNNAPPVTIVTNSAKTAEELNLEAKQKEQAAVQKAKENDPYLVAVTDIDIDDAEENSNYLREQAEKYRTKESVDKLKEAYFKQYQLSKALWKDNDPEYNQFMQDYFETVKAWQIKWLEERKLRFPDKTEWIDERIEKLKRLSLSDLQTFDKVSHGRNIPDYDMMHVGMSGLLRGTMAHEMNHSINSYPAGTQGNREDGTNESYSEDETAMYDDKPSEHRSNIQQLRYIFNLSPSATVTETDVARMRKECKEKGIAIWLFSNPDKYTDKRIAEMFNLFVQNDNQDKLSQRNLAGIGGLLRKPVWIRKKTVFSH